MSSYREKLTKLAKTDVRDLFGSKKGKDSADDIVEQNSEINETVEEKTNTILDLNLEFEEEKEEPEMVSAENTITQLLTELKRSKIDGGRFIICDDANQVKRLVDQVKNSSYIITLKDNYKPSTVLKGDFSYNLFDYIKDDDDVNNMAQIIYAVLSAGDPKSINPFMKNMQLTLLQAAMAFVFIHGKAEKLHLSINSVISIIQEFALNKNDSIMSRKANELGDFADLFTRKYSIFRTAMFGDAKETVVNSIIKKLTSIDKDSLSRLRADKTDVSPLKTENVLVLSKDYSLNEALFVYIAVKNVAKPIYYMSELNFEQLPEASVLFDSNTVAFTTVDRLKKADKSVIDKTDSFSIYKKEDEAYIESLKLFKSDDTKYPKNFLRQEEVTIEKRHSYLNQRKRWKQSQPR